jgi:hypothetical protein
MRYSVFALLIAFAFIFSCNTSKTSNKFLSPENLATGEYTIDISRDTTLVTLNGALLKIPKGSLTTDKGNTVTLEIKEAYSLQQIIQAGLTTQSNGEPLSSGGMIYINAKGEQNVKITQAIKVAIPTGYLSNNMQLFKGQKDENGNINWNEPASLPENKQLTSVQQGQVLFQSKCAGCHAIGKDMTGPNLAHFMKRFPATEEKNDWYYDHGLHPYFTETERAVDSAGKLEPDYFYDHYNQYDPYYVYKCNLVNRYGSTGPRLASDTNGDDLLNVYRYIQNESDRLNLPLPVHANLKDCADSCINYKKVIANLKSEADAAKSKKDKLISENGGLVKENNKPTAPATTNEPIGPPPTVDYEERVSPRYYQAEYYQFTIESFGWYNIDILLKGINGVEESELFVLITGQYRENIKVYLIIPSEKVYVEGGLAERNPEEFAFYLKNGKIPLPQNAKAYIMAVTETEESIAFALKEFNTSLKQEFDISLVQSTKDAFIAAVNGINLDKLSIRVAEAKNASEIRQTNTELKNIEQELKNAETLKPKNCDCDCGMKRDAPTTVNEAISNK